MRNETVKVIITSFKNPEYLRECMISLLNQTHTEFEAEIIDDASPEDPKHHIEDILATDKRFKYQRLETNIGGPAIFNQASDRLDDFKYVLWLHHDDWIHPQFLERMKGALDDNPECTFAYALISRVINGIPRNDFPTSIRPDLPTGAHDISIDTVINCWIMWSSALVRVDSLKRIGGIGSLYRRNETSNIKSIYRKGESDLYIFARLASLGPAYTINERLCYYRDHSDSNTHNRHLSSTHIEDNIRTYNYIFGDIDFFSYEVRLAAKINSVGRLLTGEGLANTCARIFFSGLLSQEISTHREKTIERLSASMQRFIVDSADFGFPRTFSDSELTLMTQLHQASINYAIKKE
jgi:glycosyltransferase involved in cell wall biosynthesis